MNSIMTASDEKKTILKYSVKKTYNVNLKNNTIEGIKIKKVLIYDEKRIIKFITNSINKRIEKIMKKAWDAFNDGESNGALSSCLDDIARLKDILNLKYKNFLKKEEYDNFLKIIMYLEKTILNRFIELREQEVYNEVIGGRI